MDGLKLERRGIATMNRVRDELLHSLISYLYDGKENRRITHASYQHDRDDFVEMSPTLAKLFSPRS